MRAVIMLAALVAPVPGSVQVAGPLPVPLPSAGSERMAPMRQQSEEALELGRRLAELIPEREVMARFGHLLAEAHSQVAPEAKATPRRRSSLIVATPPSGLRPDGGFAAHQLLIDRLGKIYAREFELGELRAMVAFFQSPAGRRLRDEQAELLRQSRALLGAPYFREDLIGALCDEQRQRMARRGRSPAAEACQGEHRVPAGTPAFGRERAAFGLRIAEAGSVGALFEAAGAAEIDRLIAATPSLGESERRRLREIGAARIAAERRRIASAAALLFARHMGPDELRATAAFFEGPAGQVYVKGFGRLVPEMVLAFRSLGLGGAIPPGLMRLGEELRKNRSDVVPLGSRIGSWKDSRRLAAASDFTALAAAMAGGIGHDAAREQRTERIAHAFEAAYAGAVVPLRPEIPDDPTGGAALPYLAAFFESPAGRAYTAAVAASWPELEPLLKGSDWAAAARADFCRETGKSCGP